MLQVFFDSYNRVLMVGCFMVLHALYLIAFFSCDEPGYPWTVSMCKVAWSSVQVYCRGIFSLYNLNFG